MEEEQKTRLKRKGKAKESGYLLSLMGTSLENYTLRSVEKLDKKLLNLKRLTQKEPFVSDDFLL